ncbi:quinoprotein relay system zinc metallohydrolase 2 [Salinarimonas soli]|uniref:Quinoprotein relay system zinc metallohydrolase 2 n=2 Tax=Salinarimonas soli TaxID=1638099 RepID=A0A5B2VG46_9HYPH|nr:quinoprotein relay system zinc metallohydrolase 2 [Salinarimonas soli]
MPHGARRLALVLGVCTGLAGRAAAQAPEPLPMQEVAPGVFVYAAPIALAAPDNHGAIANLGFIVGRDAVAVVDTGGSFDTGRRLVAAVRARTALPIRYAIDTHVHPDHLLGNAALVAEEAQIVGHANLPAALAARRDAYLDAGRRLIGGAFAGTEAVAPTILVADTLALDLGGRVLRLEAWPTAHTNTDITVLDEATGTWFLGDLLFVGHIPALDGRLKGWLATLQRLKARSAARIVPGHGPPSVPWPAAAEPMERYLTGLERDVRTMIREGRTLGEAAERAGEAEAGRWSLFEAFAARNATSAFQELEWE